MRWSFDKITNYGPHMTEKKWLFRIGFLETVRCSPTSLSHVVFALHPPHPNEVSVSCAAAGWLLYIRVSR